MPPEFRKRLQILVIENNPVDSAMLKGMLMNPAMGDFDLEMVDSLNLGLQLLAKKVFDVVLLDLNLRDTTGLETLERLNKKYPHVPIVVNTGAYQEELGLKAVTCGAQDYLIKGKYKSYGLVKSLYYAVERKKAELELQSAYERLKEMQTQLIDIEKMNVVGGLASGVAHEVKNPLATIFYGIEFLSKKISTDDEQIKVAIKSIKDAAKRANDIVKDLLDFASLSRLKKHAENLNEIIEKALSLVKHQGDKSCVKVIKKMDTRLPRVLVDRNRIEQVIVDVLLNAIYAMRDGGTLTIKSFTKTLTKDDAELIRQPDGEVNVGDKVIIVDIEDTGCGIKKEHLGKLFDPFFTTRRAAGGVGLGLSIAKTIMINHDGFINVANKENRGVRSRLIFRT